MKKILCIKIYPRSIEIIHSQQTLDIKQRLITVEVVGLER